MLSFNKSLASFWTTCRMGYVNRSSNQLVKNIIRSYTAETAIVPKKSLKFRTKKDRIKPNDFSLALLVIPITAFGLGTWQIFRKFEKEKLIKKLGERIHLLPVDLPQDLNKLKDLEYCPVKVKGTFDHSKEILMGPRSRIKENQKYSEGSGLLSNPSSGFLVITPFKLSDRNLTILVNRGWVPATQKPPHSRQEGQITGEVELIGLVRLSESRKPLGMKNIPERGIWMYKDFYQMSEATGAAPILIDAVDSVPGGPIGKQTVIGLRNEHLVYIWTWYSLAIATGIMWYGRYIKRLRP